MVGTEGQGDIDDSEGQDDFNPAISDDEDKKEYFDTPEELDRYTLVVLHHNYLLVYYIIVN